MAKKRKIDRAEGLSRGMDIENIKVIAQLLSGQSNNIYKRNLHRVENFHVKVESLLKEKKMVWDELYAICDGNAAVMKAED